MSVLIKVNGSSKGAEKRLYKAIRLMLLYKYKADNACWRAKTSDRYMAAYRGMKVLVLRMAIKLCGKFSYWTCVALGSRKAIDLEANRRLSFLLTLSDKEDMS